MFTGLLIGLVAQLTLMAEPLLKPGDIVYADGGWDVILRYDPQTQETNLVTGFELTDARGNIAVGHNGDSYGTRAKLGFGPYAEFFVIDGMTGATRELSTQRLIKSAYRMKLAPDGEWLYVAGEDATNRAIYKVEIATGNQVLVTTNFNSGPEYERPYDVAFDGKGGIYVSDFNFGSLIHFDGDGGEEAGEFGWDVRFYFGDRCGWGGLCLRGEQESSRDCAGGPGDGGAEFGDEGWIFPRAGGCVRGAGWEFGGDGSGQ